MSTIPTSIPTHPRLTREDILDGRDVAELLHHAALNRPRIRSARAASGRKLGRRWIFLRAEIEAMVRGHLADRSAA
jgi:hypothetical protein